MVTIARFFEVNSAELARMALEASGIPTHLHSMKHAAMIGGGSYLGGVRIMVPRSRAEDARAILKALAEQHGRELY